MADIPALADAETAEAYARSNPFVIPDLLDAEQATKNRPLILAALRRAQAEHDFSRAQREDVG